MRKFAALSVVTLLFGIIACAQLGLTVPENTSQRLAYAYSMVTAVRQQAVVSLENKRISVADAQQVQRLADLARVSLDQARDMVTKGDQANGLKTLQIAEQILLQLQTYMKTKETQAKGKATWALQPPLQSS